MQRRICLCGKSCAKTIYNTRNSTSDEYVMNRYIWDQRQQGSLPSLGYSKKQVFRNRAWFIAHMTYACKSRPVAFTNYKRCLVSLRINMHTTRDTGNPETCEMNITVFKLTSLTVCTFFLENHWYCCGALDFGGSALNQEEAQKSYFTKSKILLNSRGFPKLFKWKKSSEVDIKNSRTQQIHSTCM